MRRKSTTVGDVDILVCTSFSSIVIDAFSKMVPRDSVISKGDTKCSIFLEVPMVTCGCDGSDDVVSLRVDLLCVPEKSWGAALNYFTGSVSHNVELRALAKSKGLRVNEFGIFRRSDGKRVGGSDERDLYNLLGIAYVAPEDRS
jgi:DNA polymerase (family 10)